MVDNNKLQSRFSERINNSDKNYTEKLDIRELKILTRLFATFILASDSETLFIIDQHAAHERVNYERFKKSLKYGDIEAQGLLMPYLFSPPAAVGDLNAYTPFFSRLGYEIDEFGENTWAARSFPAFVSYSEGEAFLMECMAALGEEKYSKKLEEEKRISYEATERIMMRACKASVKANQSLSDEECAALLEALSKCDNPYTCPHSRPVMLKLAQSDIERLFKRS